MKNKKIKYIPCSFEDELKEEHLQFKPFDSHIKKATWNSRKGERKIKPELKLKFYVLTKDSIPVALYPVTFYNISKLQYVGFKSYDDCLQFYIEKLHNLPSTERYVELKTVYRIDFTLISASVLNINLNQLEKDKIELDKIYQESEENKINKREKIFLFHKEKRLREKESKEKENKITIKEKLEPLSKRCSLIDKYKTCPHCKTDFKIKEGELPCRFKKKTFCSQSCYVEYSKNNKKEKVLTERQKTIQLNKKLKAEGNFEELNKIKKEKLKKYLQSKPKRVYTEQQKLNKRIKRKENYQKNKELNKEKTEKEKAEKKRLRELKKMEKLPKKFCLLCSKEIIKKVNQKLSGFKKIIYCSKSCSSKAKTKAGREERKKKIEQVRQAFKNWDEIINNL